MTQNPERSELTLSYQVLREWLAQQEGGQTVVDEFERDPKKKLPELQSFLLQHSSALPVSSATHVSGGQVEKLVNIAYAHDVNIRLMVVQAPQELHGYAPSGTDDPSAAIPIEYEDWMLPCLLDLRKDQEVEIRLRVINQSSKEIDCELRIPLPDADQGTPVRWEPHLQKDARHLCWEGKLGAQEILHFWYVIRAVRDRARLRRKPLVRLVSPEGKTDPEPLSRASGNRSWLFGIPLVNRDELFQDCQDLICEAKEIGLSGAVALVGDTGVGKSRVAEELARLARSLDCLVYLAAGASHCPNPMWSVVEQHARHTQGGPPPNTAPTLKNYIVTGQHRKVLETVKDIVSAAGGRLVVFILEDMHWADEQGWGTLRALQTGAPAHSLIFFTVDKQLCPDWNKRVISSRAEKIWIDPLVPEDAVMLLKEALRDGEGMGHLVLERINQKARGNPLIAQEVLNHLRGHGKGPLQLSGGMWRLRRQLVADELDGVDWTHFESVYDARIAQLDEEARLLAETAAVIGTRFECEIVEAVAAENHLAPLGFSKIWRRLAEEGIISSEESGEREFCSEGLSQVLRKRLEEYDPRSYKGVNRQAALLLEKRGGGDEAGQELGRIATFRLRAGDLTQAAELFDASRDAHLREAQYKPAQKACELLIKTLEEGTAEWDRAHRSLLEISVHLGDYNAALDILDRLRPRAMDAASRCFVDVMTGWIAYCQNDLSYATECYAAAERSAHEPGILPRLRFRLYKWQGVLAAKKERPERAEEFYTQAEAYAATPRDRAEILLNRAAAMQQHGAGSDEVRPVILAALEQFNGQVPADLEAQVECNLGHVADERIRQTGSTSIDSAVRHYRRALRLARSTGDFMVERQVLRNLVELYIHAGQIDDAQRALGDLEPLEDDLLTESWNNEQLYRNYQKELERLYMLCCVLYVAKQDWTAVAGIGDRAWRKGIMNRIILEALVEASQHLTDIRMSRHTKRILDQFRAAPGLN